MSLLTVYSADNAERLSSFTGFDEIANVLDRVGVKFERWSAATVFSKDAGPNSILQAYEPDIQKLMNLYGFQSADTISLAPDHPNVEQLRAKFLNEHTHSDFEVRFFVQGCGLFYLHIGDLVFGLLCERDDLISVPAMTKHWFDMGSKPMFTCIRLFTTEEGWIADFTGDTIAKCYPTLDNIIASK
jgi:1,2-dihydroxy-3-keto-5-methylthiopentene dioxygenase